MANINVNPSKLKQLSGNEETVSRQLKGIAAELRACNNALKICMKNSSYYNVQRSLDSVSQNLDNRANQTYKLSTALGQISNQYSSSESNIKSIKVTKNKMNSAKDSIIKKILDSSFDISGSVWSGGISKVGMGSVSTLGYSILGGSAKLENKSGFKDGNLYAEKSAKLEGHLAEVSAKNQYGLYSEEVVMGIGVVEGTGAVGFSLFKDNKLSPSVYGKIGGEATALNLDVKQQVGTDQLDIHLKENIKLATAAAKAETAVGVINKVDDDGNVIGKEFGAKASAGAEAYYAKGTVTGGMNIFGIKIDADLTGNLGGAGAKAESKITTGGASGKIGLGVAVGLDVGVNVDWSGFKMPEMKIPKIKFPWR